MTGLDPAQQDEDGLGLDPAPDGLESAAALPDDEEDDAPADADGTPGPVAARPVSRRRHVPPASVGVSFYVRGAARVRVSASAASYRRVRGRGAAGRFAAGRPDADSAGGAGPEGDAGDNGVRA